MGNPVTIIPKLAQEVFEVKPFERIAGIIGSSKEIIVVVLALTISIGAGFCVFSLLNKEVKIVENGIVKQVNTIKTTVGEVLAQNNIKIESHDYISIPLDSKLKKKTVIEIKRAVPVKFIVGGEEREIWTYHSTVGEMLYNNGIELGEKDKLNYALEDPIVSGMEVKLTRVREELEVEQEPIEYKVVTRENSRLDQGVENVLREGKEGIVEKKYKVVYEDDKVVSRQMVEENVVEDPIDKLVEYGTVMNFRTSRGEIVRYSKVLTNMRATAYDLSFESCEKYPDDPLYGITYTGTYARQGTVAVDPTVIPLGSRLYIDVIDPSVPDYGFAVAEDIGGAIKGDLIDLFFEDPEIVKNWGMKYVNVYILTD